MHVFLQKLPKIKGAIFLKKKRNQGPKTLSSTCKKKLCVRLDVPCLRDGGDSAIICAKKRDFQKPRKKAFCGFHIENSASFWCSLTSKLCLNSKNVSSIQRTLRSTCRTKNGKICWPQNISAVFFTSLRDSFSFKLYYCK
jgi:hypothetical protein